MDRFNRFSTDRDDDAPRPRKGKAQRGGAKNLTHEFSHEYEKSVERPEPEKQEAEGG